MQIEQYGGLRERGEVNHPEFVALTVVDGQLTGLEVQILRGQRQQLGVADFGRKDQRDECVVAEPGRFFCTIRAAAGEQGADLPVRQNHVVGAFLDGGVKLGVHGVFWIAQAGAEAGLFASAEECAKLYQILPDRGGRSARLHERVAVGNHIGVVGVVFRCALVGRDPEGPEAGQPRCVVVHGLFAFRGERSVAEIGRSRGVEFFDGGHRSALLPDVVADPADGFLVGPAHVQLAGDHVGLADN